jgi:hypothetical protein
VELFHTHPQFWQSGGGIGAYSSSVLANFWWNWGILILSFGKLLVKLGTSMPNLILYDFIIEFN